MASIASESRENELSGTPIRRKVTCPHCWHEFSTDSILWVSQHTDLLGDRRLGSDFQRRFLPSRFNVQGDAIDARGFACKQLACPHCHLVVPRAMLEAETVFFSIVGSPASGKSYLLAAMTWQLRQVFARAFALSFGDTDPDFNRILNANEERLFHSSDKDKLVAIRKTELEGELYDEVRFGEQPVRYPRPFVFTLKPLHDHPNAEAVDILTRVVCLYDNAGEHFLPGADSTNAPVTRHLAESKVLFFVFDPTQDQRFVDLCRGVSRDPQLKMPERLTRQEAILHEMAERVRRHTGLPQSRRHDALLVFIVNKLDVWQSLYGSGTLDCPWKPPSSGRVSALRVEMIRRASKAVRDLLFRHSPEVVSAAESFCSEVLYLPVSPLGRSPETATTSDGRRMLAVRPRDVRPQWAEVPLLYALWHTHRGIIPHVMT